MLCPHGVVNGQCNECLAEEIQLTQEMLAEIVQEEAEMRDRFQHGMMTKQEVDDVLKQKENP